MSHTPTHARSVPAVHPRTVPAASISTSPPAEKLGRFDYTTKTWATADLGGRGGLAQDHNGRIWTANDDGVTWLDAETLAIGDTVVIPSVPMSGPDQVKGVSVDVDGYVWAVRLSADTVYRIDPDDYSMASYTGLDLPYTYSDFSGGQIQSITCVPEG